PRFLFPPDAATSSRLCRDFSGLVRLSVAAVLSVAKPSTLPQPILPRANFPPSHVRRAVWSTPPHTPPPTSPTRIPPPPPPQPHFSNATRTTEPARQTRKV